MSGETKFDPTKFTVDGRWWKDLWGGGHTTETDPTRRGWQARKTGTAGCIIVGRSNVKGCFSAMQLTSCVDVCVYDDKTPQEVAEAFKIGEGPDGVYTQVPDIPGWALGPIQAIEADELAQKAKENV